MRNNPKTDGKYNVVYTIMGKDYNDPNKASRKLTFKVEIEFSYDPDDYGNGYYMDVEGENEPWGFSGYDIRYDTKFNPEKKISYIARFFEETNNGQNGAWILLGIAIEKKEG